MKKRLNFIALCGIVLLVLLSAAGCRYQSASAAASPTNISVEPQSIINNTISAMSQVSSYQLDTDVANYYTVPPDKKLPVPTTEWKISRKVDLKDQAMHFNLTVLGSDMNGNTQLLAPLENIYYFNGWNYYLVNDGSYVKVPLIPERWTEEAQISQMIGMLKTADNLTLSGEEIVNGIKCDVVNISPSIESMVDWVESQYQDFGPAELSTAPALIGPNYLKYFRNSRVQVWIAQDSYLLMKAEIYIHFEASWKEIATIGGDAYVNSRSGEVVSDFQGQMNFSNYNQPLSIKLPPEVANARLYYDR